MKAFARSVQRLAAPWILVVAACASSGAGVVPGPRPSVPAPPAATVLPGDLAITNVTVVPMSRAGVLEHHTVVVRGDRIVAVAPSASLAVPAGATTIDGTNKWLMPGLADMHVHTGSETDLTLFLAAGVTTVRNMFGGEMHLAWRSQIAAGERLGPTIVTAGPIIDGDPPVWGGSAVLVDPAAADPLVAEQKAKGYDFLKPYSRLSRAAYEALAAAGKKHGMRLAGHVPDAVGLLGVLAARQQSIEHLDGWLIAMAPDGVTLPKQRDFAGKLGDVLPRLELSKLPGLVAQTIAAGTWNCPTLIVFDRYGALEGAAALKQRATWSAEVSPATIDLWEQMLSGDGSATWRAMTHAENAWRAKVFAALSAANAPIIVGTDTGNPFVIPGEAMHEEIELMVAGGMPRARVLRAATAAAAEYLETPGAFGVVEPGARADLVLATVNPLTEPLPLVPDGVMVRGRWLTHADLEAKLAEIAKHYAAPPAKVRWDDMPPLVAIGKDVRQPRYEIATRGKPSGEERLAVGVIGRGKRAIVTQAVDSYYGIRIETSSSILPDTVTVAVKSPYGASALAGSVTGGNLVITGHDAAGKPVSLSAPLPAGGFLSGPGVGGAFALAGQLTGMKVGDKRALASLEIVQYPAVAIDVVRYDVARQPDARGHRTFAVTSTRGKRVATIALELDDGGVVSQRLGPPLDTVVTRIPE